MRLPKLAAAASILVLAACAGAPQTPPVVVAPDVYGHWASNS